MEDIAVSTRRALLQGAALGTAVLLASACGVGRPGPEKLGTRPVTLTWAVRGGGTPERREELLREYKQLRPNVTVDQFDASGGIAPSLEKLGAGLAAGVPLDFVNGHLSARQLIESIDFVQPIDDLVRQDKFDLGKYNKDALDSTGRYEGKLYTLPYAYGGDVAAVAFNKGLFRQAGVPDRRPTGASRGRGTSSATRCAA